MLIINCSKDHSFKSWLSKGILDEVVSVTHTDLLNGIVNRLQVQSTHSPQLLLLTVNHHRIWVRTDLYLLGKCILLTLL